MAGTFNRMMRDINEDKVLIPVIRAALSKPRFKGFTVPVDGWDAREHDGWFHPSTHATWTARQLYYYLVEPDAFEPEKPSPLFVLAVTQGKFWHEFIQRLMLDLGLLIRNPGSTPKDPIVKQAEIALKDEIHNRKGHADGRRPAGELFEFKTMNDYQNKRVRTWEDIRDLAPEYYAQTQDYLHMAGALRMRYLIMALASPFPMEEIVVPADPDFQEAQSRKYILALRAVDRGEPPPACCAPRSKQAKGCPARFVCPVGMVS